MNLTKDFGTVDVISVILIIACAVLLYQGKDSFVAATITGVMGYYYGHRRKIENSVIKK